MKYKKNNFYISILIFYFSPYIINAQDYKIVDSISVGINNVKDFKMNNGYYYLLNNNNIYRLNNWGTILDSNYVKSNATGLCFNNDNILLIYDSGVVKNIFDSIICNLTINKEITKFITYNYTKYFTYLLAGEYSYSNSIISFNSRGEKIFFTYLVGTAAGLYCRDNYLWHLYNKVKKNQFGMLMKYNISNGELLSEEILPVIEPVGISIDSFNYIYTYSIKTKKIYKLKKE